MRWNMSFMVNEQYHVVKSTKKESNIDDVPFDLAKFCSWARRLEVLWGPVLVH